MTRESICTFALSLPWKRWSPPDTVALRIRPAVLLFSFWRFQPTFPLLNLTFGFFFFFLLISLLCRLLTLLPLGFIAEWSITLRLKLLVFSSSAPVRHIMLPELQEFLPLEAPRVETAWYIDCPKMGWNQSLGPKWLSDVGKSLWSQSLHNWLTVGSDLEHVAQTKGLNKQKTWFFRWVGVQERNEKRMRGRKRQWKGFTMSVYVCVCTVLFKSFGLVRFF